MSHIIQFRAFQNRHLNLNTPTTIFFLFPFFLLFIFGNINSFKLRIKFYGAPTCEFPIGPMAPNIKNIYSENNN